MSAPRSTMRMRWSGPRSRAAEVAQNPRRAKARLDALYVRLPKLDCKGLCADSCQGAEPIAAEADILQREHGAVLGVRGDGACSLLTAGGGCSVYADRPLVCRAWGAVESMPCEHGCLLPGERELTVPAFYALMADAYEVAGEGAKARKLREAMADPEKAHVMEGIARRGQTVSFDCPECGARVPGTIGEGEVARCPGCAATYRLAW